MSAELDLVAVSYNAPTELREFLRSVAFEVDVPFTFTLIDNASPNPEVREIFHEWENRLWSNPFLCKTNFVLGVENEGYARACNWGASQGEAPFIGLLNCDIKFLPGSASGVTKHFDNPKVGVVGPKTTTSSGDLTHAGIIKHSDGHDRHRAWMQPDSGQHNDIITVPTVSGATYFVRRDMWTELTTCPFFQKSAPGAQGAFLPTPHYYEETFCSYHARAHGWDVLYAGDVKMIHEWHRSSGNETNVHMGTSELMFHAALLDHRIEWDK